MKIKLDECRHRFVERWEFGWTCLGCFQRLWMVSNDEPYSGSGYLATKMVPADPWDGQCLHIVSFLKPIDTKGSSMHRAVCNNCGCIIEHPPGEGKWTPVLFYGFVIHEELW